MRHPHGTGNEHESVLRDYNLFDRNPQYGVSCVPVDVPRHGD
jgi:hypothetical protein